MVNQEFVKKVIGNFKWHKGKRGTFGKLLAGLL